MRTRLKDFRGIFIIVLIIFLIVGGSLVYDFTKKSPEPSKYSIRSLTHSDNVEKVGHFNSNLINVSSPFLYGYLIRSENEKPYLVIVERSYGKDKEVDSYYFKMNKMIEMSREEKGSFKELLNQYHGKSILGKNEVFLTEKDISTVKTFYKIDMGDQIIWSTNSMDYYIKVDDNKYDFLKTF
jgi:hypothetical protein